MSKEELYISILSFKEVSEKGINFKEGVLHFGGQFGDQVCSSSNDTPVSGLVYEVDTSTDDPQLSYYCSYVAGYETGELVKFYPNGSVKERITMLEGSRHGSSVGYFLSGELQYESTHQFGVLTSRQEWDTQGTLVSEISSPTVEGQAIINRSTH